MEYPQPITFIIKNKDAEADINRAIELKNYVAEKLVFQVTHNEINEILLATLEASKETFESLIYLVNEQYIYQANIVIRSYLELVIRMGLISQSDTELVMAKIEDEIERKKKINSIIEFNNAHKSEALNEFGTLESFEKQKEKTIESINTLLKSINTTYESINGRDIKQKCKILDELLTKNGLQPEPYNFEKLYVWLYRYLSGQVHFDITSLRGHLTISKDGTKTTTKASTRDTMASINAGINLYAISIFLVNSKLKVLNTDELEKISSYIKLY